MTKHLRLSVSASQLFPRGSELTSPPRQQWTKNPKSEDVASKGKPVTYVDGVKSVATLLSVPVVLVPFVKSPGWHASMFRKPPLPPSRLRG